ncbi:MAG TPA: hypothetical protein VMT27_07385, partial [Actinomycetes bacterium]|nr:hypothetical protein [Actinomycetes bacterium]
TPEAPVTPSVRQLSRRVKILLACTAIFALLAVAALVVPMWIEEVTGLSPDGGSGEAEALLAIPFGVASLVLGVLTWRSQRQLRARQAI